MMTPEIIDFLLQIPGVPQSFFTLERMGFIIGLLVLGIANYYQFRNGRIEKIHETDTKVIQSKDRLLGTQDVELKKLKEDHDKKCEDFDSLDLEYRALASFDIKELLNFSKMKKDLELKDIEISVLTETVTIQKKRIIELEINAKL